MREAISVKTARDSGLELTPDQVLVTNGGKQAVFNTLMVLLNPGDEVLLPTPAWVTYPEAIALAGGVAVRVRAEASDGFRVTPEMLEAGYSARTKALVFVSPSNPTGAVYSPKEVAAIGRWAAERNLWVLSDEIYEHLVYQESGFASMPVVVPELAERCVVVNGVSKAYAMTGWRVGWMAGPTSVIDAATNLQSHSTSNVCNVAQEAALAAVAGPLDPVVEMRNAFDRRRKAMYAALTEIPGLECVEPQGAFYAFPSMKGMLGHRFRGHTAESTLELANIVLDLAHVAFVPGEAFGSGGYGRFSYALSDDDLKEGLQRIAVLAQTD